MANLAKYKRDLRKLPPLPSLNVPVIRPAIVQDASLAKRRGANDSRTPMIFTQERETFLQKQVQEYNALNAVITDRLGAAVPPFDPFVLLGYLDENAYLMTANRWKVAGTVGPGFTCSPALQEHLTYANHRDTFRQFLKKWALDIECYGYAFHETQRGHSTASFYNLASIKTRVKPFLDGSRKYIHYEYGLGLLYWQEYSEFDSHEREGVSMFNLPSVRGHLYYGDAEWTPARKALESNINILQVGLKYFENSLISDLSIVLKGTELDPDERENIRQYLSRAMKGVDNAHKILFFEVGPNEDVNLTPLNMKYDDSLLNTRKENKEEIIVASRVPQRLVGVLSAGQLGGVAEVQGQMKLFKLGFSDDRMQDYTDYWRKQIDMAGLPDAETFQFNPMEIDTDAADLAALTTAAGAPIMTPEQAFVEWQTSKSVNAIYKSANHFCDYLRKAGKLEERSTSDLIDDLAHIRKQLEEENG